jgi:hypothetical protein
MNHVLLATFFVGLMTQEIIFTPLHLVRDASNFQVFTIIYSKTECQASRIHWHISINVNCEISRNTDCTCEAGLTFMEAIHIIAQSLSLLCYSEQ